MNNQVRSIKCPQCGLIHFYSTDGVCPNCGRFVQIAKPKKSKTTLLIIVSVVVTVCASVIFVFATAQHKATEQPGKAPERSITASQQLPLEQPYNGKPAIGLLVNSVDAGSPAMSAGVQVGDIVIQYGDTKVLDKASFFKSQEAYANTPASSVELVVVRNARPITLTVPSGRIGFFSEEHNPVLYPLNSLLNNIVVREKLSKEQIEQAVNENHIEMEDPQTMTKRAEQLIDQAEREGTLTSSQILAARIYLIPDEATPAEETKRQELLQQLLSNQSERFILWLGQDRFYQDKKYRAAITCLNQYLKRDPSNVNARLNMGNAYNSSLMFKEAEAAVNYVIDNKLPLSRYGYGVLYQVKAKAALGNGDYRNSMLYAENSFALHPSDYMMSLWQLAAAQNGDLQQFYNVNERCRAAIPRDYARLQFQIDAVEAYALAKSKQRDRAREVANKLKGPQNSVERASRYWKQYPGGSDVAKNLKELVGTGEKSSSL